MLLGVSKHKGAATRPDGSSGVRRTSQDRLVDVRIGLMWCRVLVLDVAALVSCLTVLALAVQFFVQTLQATR